MVRVAGPLDLEKLTVWCALWAGGIIGPYFFQNDEGHNVTVNGDRYRAMITNFFIPELNNHDVQELWFQQDGATCHTARATIDLLKDTFGDRLISRFGPVNWPPRSCDLTPLNYFLWGYVKSLVYADKPQTLDHLEDNIRRVIADIRPQMLEKVIENWTSRLDYIRASRGSHMPEIIFKMQWQWPIQTTFMERVALFKKTEIRALWCNLYAEKIVAMGGACTTNLHLSAFHWPVTLLRVNREEFVDEALIYAKSLCEQLEISFEPPRPIRRKHIFGDGSKDVQLSYEDDLRRTMFSSTDRVTTEIRERFQQLQNLSQKYALLRPEVILSMDELRSSSSKH
ncbi:uncharacterized protein TNCV_2282431 [Trichonephila clavipes]|nr:uncharacterized protein TNCV_2282431 [Trichonephila clavipes]